LVCELGWAEGMVYRGVQIPRGRGKFLGKRGAQCKVEGHYAVTCAKTAEPIVMPFRLSARSDSRNHELDGGPEYSSAVFGKRVAPLLKG